MQEVILMVLVWFILALEVDSDSKEYSRPLINSFIMEFCCCLCYWYSDWNYFRKSGDYLLHHFRHQHINCLRRTSIAIVGEIFTRRFAFLLAV